MERIEVEKKFPQLVEVVNELKAKIETSETDPLVVDFPSSFVSTSGSQDRLRVSVANYDQFPMIKPTTSTLFNLHVSSVHVVNATVGTVFPVDLVVYNITSSAVANNVNAVYSVYSARYPSASSIVIFYETISSSGSVSASSYSAAD